ncbi:MAG: glycogen debranching protein [Hydrocarboniphaga sp.]|uniref:glycogen debranching protein GlgX n=1 Tax=Hydrocarboniphaga sp. TaxID=2033016 RepID=UPI00260DA4C0|nr:glycogen debranching protein GlgX [Hydrocarboniphaga sp.]MDB5970696.1 glycogen debranching protein [Hydrocarboniphaga sp.]
MESTVRQKARTVVWPGRSYPLGASWDGEGVNFALFSANAVAVDLCLFDPSGQHEIARVRLPEYSDQIWHGYLPDARPGLLYGYRVHGPYAPEHGHRFNANKLLLDPYAKSIAGDLNWSDANFGYRIGHTKDDLSFDKRDNARYMPKCRVVDTSFTWGEDRRPRTSWEETVIMETHVKGFTKLHPGVAQNKRGTFAGLVAPPVLDHLVRTGVTAVELLPVHHFLNDRHLVQRNLTNYWGYNSIGFFAPDPRFLYSGLVEEFKTTVKRLHGAGIEVILDVVYNHTAEGNHMGPTLSLRGIDNASYYRLTEDPRYYMDFTGTGNTLNVDHPRVLQMVMDSLRYWVSEMHVDGFRFDLCSTLAREHGNFDPGAAFLDAVRQDPLLNTVKMIAEPWDLGPYGYQVGGFPPGWAEWNGAFRDTVRKFWKGDGGLLAEMGNRVTGSSDIYDHNGRRPWSSINFVTAHDGFTLQDLVSYNDKHNQANGEDNRDGTDDNLSWNCGVEGPTDDPVIVKIRDQLKRNHLATLILSLGVPMLLAGDEMGRSQNGNNNAYCQDDAISWTQWENLRPEDQRLQDFVRRVIALRRRHRVFSRPGFFRGKVMAADGLKDITWLAPSGNEQTHEDWNNGMARCLGWVLGGAAGEYYTPGGQRDIDDSFMVLMNAHHEEIEFCMPDMKTEMRWELLIDTALESGFSEEGRFFSRGQCYRIQGRSMALLINRAEPAGFARMTQAEAVGPPTIAEEPANDESIDAEPDAEPLVARAQAGAA